MIVLTKCGVGSWGVLARNTRAAIVSSRVCIMAATEQEDDEQFLYGKG